MSRGQQRTCSICGSQWFTTAGVTLSSTNQVTGYAAPVHCATCGNPLEGVADPGLRPVPDSRSLAREKARSLADAAPGVWVRWKTYGPDQLSTARVAASDIRTGKIKTIAAAAGVVEARTVRLPDGAIAVEVTRRLDGS